LSTACEQLVCNPRNSTIFASANNCRSLSIIFEFSSAIFFAEARNEITLNSFANYFDLFWDCLIWGCFVVCFGVVLGFVFGFVFGVVWGVALGLFWGCFGFVWGLLKFATTCLQTCNDLCGFMYVCEFCACFA
jgi:ABC-type nitrate/sulfonate/bicarbonate transport system permease component